MQVSEFRKHFFASSVLEQNAFWKISLFIIHQQYAGDIVFVFRYKKDGLNPLRLACLGRRFEEDIGAS